MKTECPKCGLEFRVKKKKRAVSCKSRSAGSLLIDSTNEYILDIEAGAQVSWDGDDFFGLLEHLKKVKSELANR